MYAASFIPPHIPPVTQWLAPQATAEKIASNELDLSSIDSNFRLPEQLALSINRLWYDPVIPQIMDYHSSEFYLMDSAS